MTINYKYLWDNGSGIKVTYMSLEHFLYPKEIAKIYRLSNDNGLGGSGLINKILSDHLKSTNDKNKFYYECKSGKLIRCYPKYQYHSAIVEYTKGGTNMADIVNKTCPHCGATMFLGTYTIPVVIEVKETDDKSERYNILKKNENGATFNIMKCGRCKADITEEDLIASVICKECNRNVSPKDVDENGVCDVCRAKKERADLANATTEELIHRLLQLEAMNSRTMKNVIASQKVAEELDAQEQEEPAEPEQPKEEPKKRKRQVKKAKPAAPVGDIPISEDAIEEPLPAENTEELPAESVTPQEVQYAVDDITNAQDAPFPDAENLPGFQDEEEPPLPVDAPLPDEGSSIGTGFQMFDNKDVPAF